VKRDAKGAISGDTSVTYRILVVVLVALMFWWMFRVGEGKREFRESQQALRHVTSWRQEAREGTQDIEQAEIRCPDHVPDHGSRAISQSKDGTASDRKLESVENGPKSYFRSPREPSEWNSEHVASVTAACEKLMRGEYLYPLPNYDHLIEHTRIFKGAVDTVQGQKCQEWTTVRVIPGRFAPAQPLDDAQICIGLDDHLPRRIKYEKAEFIFYDWNTPIQIEGNQAPRAPLP
jgi:hypothetical protein